MNPILAQRYGRAPRRDLFEGDDDGDHGGHYTLPNTGDKSHHSSAEVGWSHFPAATHTTMTFFKPSSAAAAAAPPAESGDTAASAYGTYHDLGGRRGVAPQERERTMAAEANIEDEDGEGKNAAASAHHQPIISPRVVTVEERADPATERRAVVALPAMTTTGPAATPYYSGDSVDDTASTRPLPSLFEKVLANLEGARGFAALPPLTASATITVPPANPPPLPVAAGPFLGPVSTSLENQTSTNPNLHTRSSSTGSNSSTGATAAAASATHRSVTPAGRSNEVHPATPDDDAFVARSLDYHHHHHRQHPNEVRLPEPQPPHPVVSLPSPAAATTAPATLTTMYPTSSADFPVVGGDGGGNASTAPRSEPLPGAVASAEVAAASPSTLAVLTITLPTQGDVEAVLAKRRSRRPAPVTLPQQEPQAPSPPTQQQPTTSRSAKEPSSGRRRSGSTHSSASSARAEDDGRRASSRHRHRNHHHHSRQPRGHDRQRLRDSREGSGGGASSNVLPVETIGKILASIYAAHNAPNEGMVGMSPASRRGAPLAQHEHLNKQQHHGEEGATASGNVSIEGTNHTMPNPSTTHSNGDRSRRVVVSSRALPRVLNVPVAAERLFSTPHASPARRSPSHPTTSSGGGNPHHPTQDTNNSRAPVTKKAPHNASAAGVPRYLLPTESWLSKGPELHDIHLHTSCENEHHHHHQPAEDDDHDHHTGLASHQIHHEDDDRAEEGVVPPSRRARSSTPPPSTSVATVASAGEASGFHHHNQNRPSTASSGPSLARALRMGRRNTPPSAVHRSPRPSHEAQVSAFNARAEAYQRRQASLAGS